MLLSIPLDMEIARLYSRGINLVEGIPQWKKAFRGLFDKIKQVVYQKERI
jgi:hypothetical protein